MIGYIIYLPSYPNSVSMASRALETGTKYGWNLELYEGVNGMKQGLADYNLKVYQHKKAERLLTRPGTQGCFLSQYLLWQKCHTTKPQNG